MRRTKLPSVSSTIFQADAFILPFLCLLASFPLFCSPSHHVHTCTQMSLRSWELRFNFCNWSWSRFTSGTSWAPYWAQGWCVNQETPSVIAPYPHLSLGATSFPIRKRCLSCRCRAGRDACTMSLNGWVTSGIFVNLEYWSSLVHWMRKHGGKNFVPVFWGYPVNYEGEGPVWWCNRERHLLPSPITWVSSLEPTHMEEGENQLLKNLSSVHMGTVAGVCTHV